MKQENQIYRKKTPIQDVDLLIREIDRFSSDIKDYASSDASLCVSEVYDNVYSINLINNNKIDPYCLFLYIDNSYIYKEKFITIKDNLLTIFAKVLKKSQAKSLSFDYIKDQVSFIKDKRLREDISRSCELIGLSFGCLADENSCSSASDEIINHILKSNNEYINEDHYSKLKYLVDSNADVKYDCKNWLRCVSAMRSVSEPLLQMQICDKKTMNKIKLDDETLYFLKTEPDGNFNVLRKTKTERLTASSIEMSIESGINEINNIIDRSISYFILESGISVFNICIWKKTYLKSPGGSLGILIEDKIEKF